MSYVSKQNLSNNKTSYKYHYKKFNGMRKTISSRSIIKLKDRVINELEHAWLPEYDETLKRGED